MVSIPRIRRLRRSTGSLPALLARGYFPKELPSPFITNSFANAMASTAAPPGHFAARALTGGTPCSKPARYSLARRGVFRRLLSIPNPLHYFLLCREIMENWGSIEPLVAGTELSATAPDFKPVGRAIHGRWPQRARSELAQVARLGRRYVLRTDITRFYGGIYTHSIPWVLHTKATAKADRSAALLGNRIDYWMRLGQDQQTVGIPIGPDTSLVLAELLMQRCDQELLTKTSDMKGFRLIDDYELSFRTRTQAEDAFHLLQGCLAEYELTLNEKKTTVLELPQPLEPVWATEIKFLHLRTSPHGQEADLANYFSRIYEVHLENPDESVFQFAIARLRSEQIHPANWPLLQRLLLLCVAPEPACFPYVLEQLILRKNVGAGPLLPELEDIVNTLIQEHSALKHSSEVANAVWACLALGLSMSAKAVDSVSQCDDPVVALLALDCEQQGLVSKQLNKTLWSAHMTGDGLYDENWLLAYEANIKGWLPTVGGGDHVSTDANFGFLKASGVSFYDQTRAKPALAAPVPLPTLPTPLLGAAIGY